MELIKSIYRSRILVSTITLEFRMGLRIDECKIRSLSPLQQSIEDPKNRKVDNQYNIYKSQIKSNAIY